MSENGSHKMVVMCNHADAPHVMPTLIMSASGVAIGDEVMVFFCPGGAPALVKGELEKIREKKLKGLPDPVQLYDDILAEGGRIILCELALENKDIKPEDVRDGVEILNAPSFLLDAQGRDFPWSFRLLICLQADCLTGCGQSLLKATTGIEIMHEDCSGGKG